MTNWMPPPATNPELAHSYYNTHDWSEGLQACVRCGANASFWWADWPCPTDPETPVEVYQAVHDAMPWWRLWPDGWSPPEAPEREIVYDS